MNEWIEYIDENRCVIHLGEMMKLLFRYTGIIIFTTILLGGGAFAYSTYCITPLYQSSIKMYVNNTTNTSDTTSISSADLTASKYLVDTYAVVLTSTPTINEVIEQTGVEYSYEELCSMISIASINDTEIFSVTVTGADPEEAAEIANAIADVAPEQIMEIVAGSSVKVVEYASVASDKSSPNRTKYALLGAALGFVLGCAGILLVSLCKNGLTVEEKIRKEFKNNSVLSVIPLMGKNSRRKLKRGKNKTEEEAELCEQLSFSAGEAYKLLRENISFCFSDLQKCKIIGVTSSVRSEGKTTTSINLAYTLAMANKRVCLIDCDFRLPSIAKRLNLHRKPGMTNFLAAQPDSSNVLQKYGASVTTLYVIAAGATPPNPSELLGSKRMQEVLNVLGKNFDYLILDLPPVGVVADALTVSKMIDGMIFVVREDLYDRRIMRESMRTLEAVNTKVLGTVVTHSTTQKKHYKRYGGKYDYQSAYAEAADGQLNDNEAEKLVV